MRRVAAIAIKDLRRIYRTPSALALMLAAPIVLASLLGLAFGGAGGWEIAKVEVALVNLDVGHPLGVQTSAASPVPAPASGGQSGAPDTGAGAMLVDILRGEGLADLLEVTTYETATAARRAVDDGDAAVAVIVPPSFSRAVSGGQGPQSSAAVELYENPTQQIGPPLVAGIVRQLVQQFDGARAVASGVRAAPTAPTTDQTAEEAVNGAVQRAVWDYESRARTGGVLLTERGPGAEKGGEPGVAALVLVGMMVFFAFFGAGNVARTIVEEEIAGTLPRLFTTPSSRASILGGKFVSAFLTVVVQLALLLLAGALLFRADWGGAGQVVVLTLAAAAVASSLALLLVSFARTTAQAGAVPSGVFLVLALIGGNFVGSAPEGGTFALVQRLTPNGWLLVGWRDAMGGAAFAEIVVPLLAALAFAAVFFALAIVRFRRRYA